MERLGRYSKPVYQGSLIRKTVEMVEHLGNLPVREVSPLPQERQLKRRLTSETIAELVQAYRNGASTTDLRQRYELSQGSVIKILHGHGVEMRGQGLTDGDVATAAELYRGGKTLAQLGQWFRISPNAVRRALLATRVVMRARGGSQTEG